MTMVPTAASVRFGADRVPGVESSFRPTIRTLIDCYVYADCAPILAIKDAQVSVTLTVPDSDRVTDEDLTCGHALADAVTRYVAELERRAALDRESTAGQVA